MSEWKEYRIGDLYEVHNGLSKGGKFFGSGYPFLTFSVVFNNYFVPSELSSYVQSSEKERLSFNINKGDIFITRTSETAKELGMSCVALKDYSNATYNGFCKRLRQLHNSKVDIDSTFIGYYLRSTKFRALFYGIAGGMSTRASLANGDLLKMTIRIPYLPYQQKIASILSALDDKIAVNRRICENLEAQAQALFKHWFVDFAPFKDGKFVESELGMIPEGWRVGRLEELSSFISRGVSPKYEEGTSEWVLGQTCVRNNIVTLNNAREHKPKTKNEKWVKQWDVLLNSTGIGSLGRVGIVYFDMDNVAIDSHLTVVRVADSAYRHYVGRNLLSRQKEKENHAVGSTGQTELPKKDVLDLPIIVPPVEVLDEFNRTIENYALAMYSTHQENLRLATLRDTLLPKLMSGELKV